MIFGSSAGAWSVSAQILSPVSKGLFKRAIIESGATLYRRDKPMTTTDQAYQMAKELAEKFDCSGKHWIKCLRRVEAEKFLPHIPATMYPLQGMEFLPYSAQEAFDRLEFNSGII